MKKSVVLSSVAVSAALICPAETADSGREVRYFIGDTKSTSAMTDASFWKDANGVVGQSGDPLDPEIDYVNNSGTSVYTPNSTAAGSGKHNMHSLTLGVVGGKTGGMQTYPSAAPGHDFGEGGLICNKGTILSQWMPINFACPVTVGAPESASFEFSSYYKNTTFVFRDKFRSEAGCAARFAPHGNAMTENSFTIDFWDLTEYKGEIRVGTASTAYTTVATLRLGSDIPGTISVFKTGRIRPLYGTNAVTIGSLTLNAGSTLSIGGSIWQDDDGRFSGTNGSFKITGDFTANDPIRVCFDKNVVIPNGQTCRVPVLTVPSDQSLSAADFALVESHDDCVQVGCFEVTEDAVAGTKTLYAVFEPVVVMTSGVGVSLNYGSSMSALTNASSWSDGKLPHPDAHYLVTAIPGSTTNIFGFSTSLRTRCGTSNSDIWNFDYDDVFPGKSLTIGERATLVLLCRNFTVEKLRLLDGSAVQRGQWVPTPSLHGNIEVLGNTKFGVMDSSRIDVTAKVTGTGQIRLSGPVSNWGYPRGGCRFHDLSGFKGRILCQEFHESETGAGNGHWPKYDDNHQIMYVGAPEQFGGCLDGFDYAGVTLRRYSRIWVDASVTIPAECNRGVFVDGKLGGIINVIQSEAGVPYVFDLQVPLTINGSMVKDGPGTLKLSASTKFGSAATDTPTADSNIIDVRQGALVACTTGCVDGVSMTFTNETSLVLKVDPSDAAYSEYGLVNVKTDSPFTLKGDLTTLPLGFDVVTPAQDVKRFTGALMTVSSAAADSVRSMLPVAHSPICGFKVSPVEIERPEMDAVTFAMRYVRVGTIVSIR